MLEIEILTECVYYLFLSLCVIVVLWYKLN